MRVEGYYNGTRKEMSFVVVLLFSCFRTASYNIAEDLLYPIDCAMATASPSVFFFFTLAFSVSSVLAGTGVSEWA